VDLKVKHGPCILITGHDMADLEKLLIATEGTGVNVYTRERARWGLGFGEQSTRGLLFWTAFEDRSCLGGPCP